MATTYRALIVLWLSCAALVAAPPKPVSISGSQVWTNKNGTIITTTNAQVTPEIDTLNFRFGVFGNAVAKFDNNRSQLIDFDTVGDGSFGTFGWVSYSSSSVGGEVVGTAGISSSSTTNIQYGVIGGVTTVTSGATNIAGAFSAKTFSIPDTHVGLFAQTALDDSANPNYETAVTLFDNRTTGDTLAIYRTNGVHVSTLDSNGIWSGTAYQLSSGTSMAAPSGNNGILWNSNKVLYWVTASKTVLVSDGR